MFSDDDDHCQCDHCQGIVWPFTYDPEAAEKYRHLPVLLAKNASLSLAEGVLKLLLNEPKKEQEDAK